jgi:hypothetical protein
LQYTSYYKVIKILNKRTKKHLEASIQESMTWKTAGSELSESRTVAQGLSVPGAHMHVAAVVLSRIFSVLVESGERPYFTVIATSPLTRDVDDPARIKVMRSAFGKLLLNRFTSGHFISTIN